MPGEVYKLCLSSIVCVWLCQILWLLDHFPQYLHICGSLFYPLSKPGRPRKSSEVGGGGPGPGLPTGTPDRFVLSFYLEKKLSEYQSTWICNYMPGKYLNRLQTGMIHDCCRNGRARSRGAGGVSQSQPGSRWVLEILVHIFSTVL